MLLLTYKLYVKEKMAITEGIRLEDYFAKIPFFLFKTVCVCLCVCKYVFNKTENGSRCT